ncbi:MAG: putative RNA methyltransferase [Porticoccaceae bacterium]
MINSFKCPNCGLALIKQASSPSFRCENNHNFDRAKEGYLNLHLAQHKRSRNPGDSDEMIRSRQRFLNTGHYQFLADTLVDLLGDMPADHRLLDIGCGEGYYLEQIRRSNTSVQLVGLDISKAAVRLAAKRKLDAQLAVDSAFSIPLFDQSIDSAISVFSPIAAEEASRVLKPDGRLIMVGPGEEHLTGLTTQIYEKTLARTGNFEVIDSTEHFSLIEEVELSEELRIEGAAIADLLHMTPYYWSANPQQQAYLESLQHLATPAHFVIRIYQNRE